MKRFNSFFGDFSAAEDKDTTIFQVSMNAVSQFHADHTDTGLSLGNAGVSAGPFGLLKALLDDAVEHRAEGIDLLSVRVGILELAQNLIFPNHQGIDTRSYAEKMLDGFVVM